MIDTSYLMVSLTKLGGRVRLSLLKCIALALPFKRVRLEIRLRGRSAMKGHDTIDGKATLDAALYA